MITSLLWSYGLGSVLLVSAASLIAVVLLSLRKGTLQQLSFLLVSLAVGTLLGDAFIHLIPEAAEEMTTSRASGFVLLGLFIFFVIEKVVRWHHCHRFDHAEHVHSVGYLNLFSDGLHNFVDGVLIGASYIASIPLGIATTIAVIAHELPQEISDFGILIHAGFSRAQAILVNFLSAVVAIAGLVAVFVFSGVTTQYIGELLAITAGGFIYIAVADLVPELTKRPETRDTLIQFIAIGIGLGLMFSLTFLE